MSNPLIAWQRVRAGNELFFAPLRGRRGGPVFSEPIAAVFRCADAPVGSEMMLGQAWGSLIDVSTWGHVIDSGVLATMEYAVDTLEVPLIVVLGHDECPAMLAALRAWNDAVIPDGATRTAVEQALSSIVRRGSGADSVAAITAAHIVDAGVALLERSPVIARRVDAGTCGIVCVSSDVDTGRLSTHATFGPVGEASDTLLECV